jgi:hypothetical protein
VRNFCKYQKPKTPKFRPVTDPDILIYVASKYEKTEVEAYQPTPFPQKGERPPRQPDPSPQKGETPPQRKEVGGRRKEEPVRDGTREDDPKPVEPKKKGLISKEPSRSQPRF